MKSNNLSYIDTLMMSKDERNALSSLSSLLGGISAGMLTSKLEGKPLVEILKGEISPPEWLVHQAERILMFLENPLCNRLINPIISTILKHENIDAKGLADLARRYSSQLNIDVQEDDSVDYLIRSTELLSRRIVEQSSRESFLGLVTCPQCTFNFIIKE